MNSVNTFPDKSGASLSVIAGPFFEVIQMVVVARTRRAKAEQGV